MPDGGLITIDDDAYAIEYDYVFEDDDFSDELPDPKWNPRLGDKSLHESIECLRYRADDLLAPLPAQAVQNALMQLWKFADEARSQHSYIKAAIDQAASREDVIAYTIKRARQRSEDVELRDAANLASKRAREETKLSEMILSHAESLLAIEDEAEDRIGDLMAIEKIYSIAPRQRLLDKYNKIRYRVLAVICELDDRNKYVNKLYSLYDAASRARSAAIVKFHNKCDATDRK